MTMLSRSTISLHVICTFLLTIGTLVGPSASFLQHCPRLAIPPQLNRRTRPLGSSNEQQQQQISLETNSERNLEEKCHESGDFSPSSSDAPTCQIVGRADSKLPTTSPKLPESLFQEPYLLDKLDAYYNARAYKYTKSLAYLHNGKQQPAINDAEKTTSLRDGQDMREEDEELVSVVRDSLEDAGFQLLTRRDLDLCDALNVGYLLRLSLTPDLSNLDPEIARDFYPELFDSTTLDDDAFLFGGRCLVYWRGYSEEVTTGRLIIQKLDYLQTSLVRRSVSWIKKRLDAIEMKVADKAKGIKEIVSDKADKQSQKIKSKIKDFKETVLPEILLESSSSSSFEIDDTNKDRDFDVEGSNETSFAPKRRRGMDLARYGGIRLRFVGTPDPDDALEPFLVFKAEEEHEDPSTFDAHSSQAIQDSEVNRTAVPINVEENVNELEKDLYENFNQQEYVCEYDKLMTMANSNGRIGEEYTSPVHLLKRVSINNLVNVFTQYGRRVLIRSLFAKSTLVEPTFEEVVVVWKPLAKETKKFYPPKIVSDLADILDVDGFEQPPKPKKLSKTESLQIRNFVGVPMSNIQAVLPKTKLLFRPADALLFDTISLATFAIAAGSIRLDNALVDLLAIISVSLWVFRTLIRYSNKLARYDLLVKNFLTSKISHRNEGALKYLTSEAGLQRAVRTSLVLSWMENKWKSVNEFKQELDESSIYDSTVQKHWISDINRSLNMESEVQIDINRALKDLKDLKLVRFSSDEGSLLEVVNSTESCARVEKAWANLLVEPRLEREKRNQAHNEREKQKSNLLSNLDGDRKPIAKALLAAQAKGYTKIKEIFEDEDNRRRLESALKTAKKKGYSGYTKVKEIIKDKRSVAMFEEALLKRPDNTMGDDGDSRVDS